jgi:hypothetical protein
MSNAMSNRLAVVAALRDEQRLRDERKPYSEAVIATCELFLVVTGKDLERRAEIESRRMQVES